MMWLFITFRWLDLLDILLVTFGLYQVYKAVKGSIAINVLFALGLFYIVWLLVQALEMELLQTIFRQFINVGVIALIILFQQEIRRFLAFLGTPGNKLNKMKLLFKNDAIPQVYPIDVIWESCVKLSQERLGALIVLERQNQLTSYSLTGEMINANITKNLLISIFYKNNPTHDGAVIIANEKIKAVSCILPLTQKLLTDTSIGLRHRAGLGISEHTDAVAIIISEETGKIAYAYQGQLYRTNILDNLKKILNYEL